MSFVLLLAAIFSATMLLPLSSSLGSLQILVATAVQKPAKKKQLSEKRSTVSDSLGTASISYIYTCPITTGTVYIYIYSLEINIGVKNIGTVCIYIYVYV